LAIFEPSSWVNRSWYIVSVIQDALHRLLGPHFAFWEFVGGRALERMVLGALVSLVSEHAEVNKVARNMSALPLDRWPLEREQLRSFDFPLALGTLHNIVIASANGHEYCAV
jgi:hypothetical protein